ncbi:hypothetical protein HOS57_gp49 [Streptomyces phage AbbeyMikolon]|uniref:Uncharacterized protein n=1 Tax=Streptomyces phage AbbeyMikolon TaxID=2059880 RepID=A0A2H5BLB0_9CAUD|nr:hypothetical protein HOS57_gp49 [Streptomyces phage AbbeyMikolon]AUG87120.1 hypothetical protein SEA_ABBEYMIKOLON_49 [Streptomyces phage AbbeyMikolon]
MSATPDPREERLPRWARAILGSLRRELQGLQGEVKSLERALAEAKGGVPNTDTYLVDYVRGNTPLPMGSRIGFEPRPEEETRGRRRIMCYVDETGWLYIHGDASLRVQPQTSNALKIRLEDYR